MSTFLVKKHEMSNVIWLQHVSVNTLLVEIDATMKFSSWTLII